jgi:4-hydroxy-3-methylbut-2-enyl diphosphate reductase
MRDDMALIVEKAAKTGFCFGVKRAVDTLERVARERGPIATLGAIVHNQQVIERLASLGVRVAKSLDEIQGNIVAIGTHGVTPQLENELRVRFPEVINTTCPFVHRAQVAARRLVKAGFYIIVYGDADHPEVKGILGWAEGKGIATMDEDSITALKPLPRRLGVLSQTTQIPDHFTGFAERIIELALNKDAEIRFIDTICHDIRDRQQAARGLARRVDLMLVIGSHTSANTNHLAQLCATVTDTHLVETAKEIKPVWLKDRRRIGVTGGASTAEETINEVMAKLEAMKGV